MKGWFRTDRRPTQGGVNLRTVALTSYEIASAMAFLHKHGIVHGVSGQQGLQQCLLCLLRKVTWRHSNVEALYEFHGHPCMVKALHLVSANGALLGVEQPFLFESHHHVSDQT